MYIIRDRLSNVIKWFVQWQYAFLLLTTGLQNNYTFDTSASVQFIHPRNYLIETPESDYIDIFLNWAMTDWKIDLDFSMLKQMNRNSARKGAANLDYTLVNNTVYDRTRILFIFATTFQPKSCFLYKKFKSK